MEQMRADIAEMKEAMKEMRSALLGTVKDPGVFEEVRGTKAAVVKLENHTVQMHRELSGKVDVIAEQVTKNRTDIDKHEASLKAQGEDVESLKGTRTKVIAWAAGLSLGGGTLGSLAAKFLGTTPPQQ